MSHSQARCAHAIKISYEPPRGKRTSVYIVLVHGLNGDGTSFVNMETGVSLQQLLSKDLPTATILTYIYPNNMNNGAAKSAKPSDSIKQRAEEFLHSLALYVTVKPTWNCQKCSFENSSAFNRCKMCRTPNTSTESDNTSTIPIVFIAHSMGGLIMKAAIHIASNPYSSDAIRHSIYRRTRGCVFYATPHSGSYIADLYSSAISSKLPNIGPTAAVRALRQNNPYLQELRTEFNNIMKNHPLRIYGNNRLENILSFIEGRGEFKLVFVVNVKSAICGAATEMLFKLNYCHTDINTPAGFNDDRYSKLAVFLKRNLNLRELRGVTDDQTIVIPSHFDTICKSNQLKSFQKFHVPQFALNTISNAIFNERIRKMYDTISRGFHDVFMIEAQLQSILSADRKLDIDRPKEAKLLCLITETQELCCKTKPIFQHLLTTKNKQLTTLLRSIETVDECISHGSEYGLLQIVSKLREYCTDRTNWSFSLETQMIGKVNEIKKKFKQISDGYDKLQRNGTHIHDKGDQKKFAAISIGTAAVLTTLILAPEALLVVGVAATGVTGAVLAKKAVDGIEEKKQANLDTECIRCVMKRQNVEKWYQKLCICLDELKRVRVDERVKRENASYTAIWKLHTNIQTFQKLCCDMRCGKF